MGADCSEMQAELIVSLVKPNGRVWIVPDGPVICDAKSVVPQVGRIAEFNALKTSYSWYFVLAFSPPFRDCWAT
jgi:hypothetical protein